MLKCTKGGCLRTAAVVNFYHAGKGFINAFAERLCEIHGPANANPNAWFNLDGTKLYHRNFDYFLRCLHPGEDIAMDDAISVGIQAMACYASQLERMNNEMYNANFIWVEEIQQWVYRS